MNEIFQFFENPVYKLKGGVHLPSRNSRTVFFGTESVFIYSLDLPSITILVTYTN